MSLSRTEIALRMEIQTETKLLNVPVTRIGMQFQVNSVPVCECYLAVGANISNVTNAKAVSTEDRALIKHGAKAKVFIKLKGDMYPGQAWDENEQVLFEGSVGAHGMAATFKEAGFFLTIEHWLSDLQECSLMATYANPAEVMDFSFDSSYFGNSSVVTNANINAPGSGPSEHPQAGLVGGHVEARILDQNEAYKDIWALGIKNVLASFLERSRTEELSQLNAVANSCARLLETPTDDAVEALRRIEGPSTFLGSPYSSYTGPVSIAPDIGNIPPGVLTAIYNQITHMPLDVYKQQDPLTRLLAPGNGFLPSLGLVLIPKITSAMVVPECRSLKTAYTVEIPSHDIMSIENTSKIGVPVRAVGIQGFAADYAAGEAVRQQIARSQSTAPLQTFACYPPVEISKTRPGRIMFIGAPHWLGNDGIALSNNAIGVKDSSALPGTANPGNAPTDSTPLVDSTKLFNDYAKFVYSRSITDLNSMVLTGRLRFDVCPGSTVHVTKGGDEAELSLLAQANRLRFNNYVDAYGYVTRIVYSISSSASGSPQALTMMYLSNVRTAEQNNNPDYTVDKPPLYAKPFVGAPLIDAYMPR